VGVQELARRIDGPRETRRLRSPRGTGEDWGVKREGDGTAVDGAR